MQKLCTVTGKDYISPLPLELYGLKNSYVPSLDMSTVIDNSTVENAKQGLQYLLAYDFQMHNTDRIITLNEHMDYTYSDPVVTYSISGKLKDDQLVMQHNTTITQGVLASYTSPYSLLTSADTIQQIQETGKITSKIGGERSDSNATNNYFLYSIGLSSANRFLTQIADGVDSLQLKKDLTTTSNFVSAYSNTPEYPGKIRGRRLTTMSSALFQETFGFDYFSGLIDENTNTFQTDLINNPGNYIDFMGNRLTTFSSNEALMNLLNNGIM